MKTKIHSVIIGLVLFSSQLYAGDVFPWNDQGVAVQLQLPGLLSTNGPPQTGYGSGVFVGDGENVFLVTATHVLFGGFGSTNLVTDLMIITSGTTDAEDQGQYKFVCSLRGLRKAGRVLSSTNRDVTVVHLFTRNASITNANVTTLGEFGLALELARSPYFSLGTNILGTTSQVRVGHEVFIFGYPLSLLGRDYFRFDPMRPLVRKGIVSGKNGYNGTIILDAVTWAGNSGGPAVESFHPGINVTEFRLIGIVTQSILTPDGQNSGYTIIEPVEVVREMINQLASRKKE
jgi:S1-C subfamily serine protease